MNLSPHRNRVDLINDRFCCEREARRLAGDPAKSTLRRWVKEGIFPAPYKLGAGPTARVGWSYQEIQEWIASKKLEAA